jgi:hypothetical protein
MLKLGEKIKNEKMGKLVNIFCISSESDGMS